jgi:hypothetical protein
MAPNPLTRPLVPVELRLVEVLFGALEHDSDWPAAAYARDVLANEGHDLDAVCRQMDLGWRYGFVTWGYLSAAIQDDRPIAATIAGLAQLPAARDVVATTVNVVNNLAARYHALPLDRQQGRKLQIRWADIAAMLEPVDGPGTLRLAMVKQTLAILRLEPPGWGASALDDGPHEHHWEVGSTIRAFHQLTSVADYLDRVLRTFGPAVAPPLEPPAAPGVVTAATPTGVGVTSTEAKKLTITYIGVDGGYRGDFDRGKLQAFYLGNDLDHDLDDHAGTTRERFIEILRTAPLADQATILRAVVERFEVGAEGSPQSRTPELRTWVLDLADRCDPATATRHTDQPIAVVIPLDGSMSVTQALADAELLIASSGAANAFDRVHTALHGYLRQLCDQANLEPRGDKPSLGSYWTLLRMHHPAFTADGPRAGDIDKVQKALGAVVDALMPLRNQASLAHANDDLLAQPEAMLAINAAHTVLNYIDSRVREAGP